MRTDGQTDTDMTKLMVAFPQFLRTRLKSLKFTNSMKQNLSLEAVAQLIKLPEAYANLTLLSRDLSL
jgi:predicted membrane chloride channel (bestrophin family)